MNIFSKGDRVRIISPKHGHEGKLFVIVEVLGSDDLAHELPYRISNNFWYKASELVLVQPAYAKEYAIGAPPAAETGARGDDDYPPADWTPPPLVGAMVMFDELLNQLSGKLSPSARQMLRTHFAAEHSIRTDAEAELASVRDQLAAAEAARDAYEVALNAVLVNAEADLGDLGGVHEENMPADKRALFRVFRIAEWALRTQQATEA